MLAHLIILSFLGILNTLMLGRKFLKKCVRLSFKNKRWNIKKWQKISTNILLLIVMITIIWCLIPYRITSKILGAVCYLSLLLSYISTLIKILLRKETKRITIKETMKIVLIPLMIFGLFVFTERELLKLYIYLNINVNTFIIINVIKIFIISFFYTMDLVILFLNIRNVFKNKQEKTKKERNKFDICEYAYPNTTSKKGIKMFIGYFKDVVIILLNMLNNLINSLIEPLKVIFKMFLKIINKITNNWSIYVIIKKTFNVSFIISLLVTYHECLVEFGEIISTEIYGTIITTIIIPLVLNILGEIKDK